MKVAIRGMEHGIRGIPQMATRPGVQLEHVEEDGFHEALSDMRAEMRAGFVAQKERLAVARRVLRVQVCGSVWKSVEIRFSRILIDSD